MPNQRSPLFVHMAKNHAAISARLEAMRADKGVDWGVLLAEFQAARIVGAEFKRHSVLMTWNRVSKAEAWKEYEKRTPEVRECRRVEPAPNPQGDVRQEPKTDEKENTSDLLIKRRGQW